MTKNLAKQNVKPSTETFDGYNVYEIGKSQYGEISNQFSIPSMASPQGNQTRVELTWPSSARYRVDDMFLNFTATNASATEAPTFKNIFCIFDKVVCLVNKREACTLNDRQAIRSAVNMYLRSLPPAEIYQQLQRWRTEAGSGLVGEQVPVSSILNFTIPLFVLFPFLKGFIINQQVQRLEFEITFATNFGSLANGEFVLSNTTSNAYGTNLSYSDIRLKTIYSQHDDIRLYKSVFPTVMLLEKWETKAIVTSWTTVQTDMINIDLASVWGKRKKILGIACSIYSPSLVTAYNDTDCCKLYSGADVIGYKIKSNSRAIVELNETTKHRIERKRYSLDFNKRRFGHELPVEVVTLSTDLARLYMPETYIDLSNIEVQAHDEIPVSGISNSEKDIEIEFYCTGSVNASCTFYAVLHYLEMATFGQDGAVNILT